MEAGVFSFVSRGADTDFEYNINLYRQHIVHAGMFRLNIYIYIYIYIYMYIYIFEFIYIIELDSYLFSNSVAPFLLDTELQLTF